MTNRGDPALAMYFRVIIDNVDLGEFSSCSGLGCSVEVLKQQEGGNNGFVWQLPTRITYSDITLSRAVCRDSAKLTAWIASFAMAVTRCTASIEALGPAGGKTEDQQGQPRGDEPVATWNLDGVVPIQWTGPTFDPDSSKVATESLVLAHHGFLPGSGFGP